MVASTCSRQAEYVFENSNIGHFRLFRSSIPVIIRFLKFFCEKSQQVI